MTDHALVVGCDAYPLLPDGDLTSAVADALAMRDWLLSREDTTVTLLASPSQGGVPLGDVHADGPAGRAYFAAAVADLARRPAVGAEDRLFVYFAGHGCATDPTNPILAKDAIAFTDYVLADPAANCVGVDDLLLRLQQSCFGTIVVWVDACRDYPFRTAFQLAGLGVDPATRRGTRVLPAMFLGQATQRGEIAQGQPRVGGDFTRALLDGLRGDGAAKVYDETDDPPYVVRWSSLQRYLDARLPDQLPRLRGEGDLVLEKYPDDAFEPVTLSVDVTPAEARQLPELHGSVTFPDPTAMDDGLRQFDGPTPVHLPVPPRRHQIRVRAGDQGNKKSVDVYRDELVTLPLLDWPSPPLEGTPTWRGVHGEGRVEVGTDDPAAAIEVRDLRGEAQLTGTGGVRGSLPAGSYYAVLVDPDGHDIAEPVDVDPGYPSRVSLTAPLGPLPDVAGDDLRWAGGAAVAAVEGMRRVDGSAALVAVLDMVGGMGAVEPLGALRAAPWQLDGGWMTVVRVSPRTHRSGLVIAGAVVSVPVLPETVTGVYLGPDGLEVGLFDQFLRDRHEGVLLLDRAQRLLAAGRRGAATKVLDAYSYRQYSGGAYPAGVVQRSVLGRTLTGLALGLPLPVPDAVVRQRIVGGGLWDVRITPTDDRRRPGRTETRGI
jgi:uncharacterized caspase-like protein